MRDSDWRIIATLYEQKNITKTAELLYMSQPALTKRIQAIEEQLGISLTSRSRKGVTFTDVGEFVAEKAKNILVEVNAVKNYIKSAQEDSKRVIRIGSCNSYAVFFLPSILQGYSLIHPEIKTELTIDMSNKILKLVENKLLQVGFVRGNIETKLKKIPIAEDQVYVISSIPIKLEDLPYLQQIDFDKEPGITKNINTWWNQHFNAPPQIRMKVNNGTACKEMIEKNLGYGIFPDSRFVDTSNMYKIPLFHANGDKFVRKTWIVFDSNDSNIKEFVRFVENKVTEFV